jgi:hypothetical protein
LKVFFSQTKRRERFNQPEELLLCVYNLAPVPLKLGKHTILDALRSRLLAL